MKREANIRELVARALVRVCENHAYSNIVWDTILREHTVSESDKSLGSRIFYGTMTHVRMIDHILRKINADIFEKNDIFVISILRSALYQLRYLDRVPAYSILNESVEIVKRAKGRGPGGFVNAMLRKAMLLKDMEAEESDPAKRFAIVHSFSDEQAGELIARFGYEEASRLAEAVNKEPPLTVRLNVSKVDPEDFMRRVPCHRCRLSANGVVVSGWSKALGEAIERGECMIQDEASQLVAEAMGSLSLLPEGGAIWDACAGNGGKSWHILDLISRETLKLRLVASDVYGNKVKRLKAMKERLFPDADFRATIHDASEGGSVIGAPFAVAVVDAPCSGYGVWRRHPESKVLLPPKPVSELVEIQRNILDNVCKHVIPGGLLIYSVCTFNLEEGRVQVERFLERHPDWRIENSDTGVWAQCDGILELLPHVSETDGFTIARLRRE